MQTLPITDDASPETPVTNNPEREPLQLTRQIKPSSPGTASRAVPLREDGTEDVEGYRVADARAPESWRPDTNRPKDVAEATYGPAPPSIEAVVGSDERVRIANPGIFPWCINASLQILAPDGVIYIGTAWFISPRTLVTAGHCVFIHDKQGRYKDWAREIRVMPGRNGTSLPFGAATSTSFRTVAGWARDKDEHYDYGAVVLPLPVGDETGLLGTGVFPDSELVGRIANIAGYPSDKTGPDDGTMWYDARRIAAVDDLKVYYEIDTEGGQSGSAVYVGDGDQRQAIGIHAYGHSVFGNSATRITPDVAKNLDAWRE